MGGTVSGLSANWPHLHPRLGTGSRGPWWAGRSRGATDALGGLLDSCGRKQPCKNCPLETSEHQVLS